MRDPSDLLPIGPPRDRVEHFDLDTGAAMDLQKGQTLRIEFRGDARLYTITEIELVGRGPGQVTIHCELVPRE